MNLLDAPAESDSQSQQRRPPPAQRLHSKCFTPPPCQTLHQANKSSQRRRCRFHIPFFFLFASLTTKLKGQSLVSGVKHTLDLAWSGSRGAGTRGLEGGQRSETGWHFTRGDSRLCQKPASVQRPLTATDQRSRRAGFWLTQCAGHPTHPPCGRSLHARARVILSATQYKKRKGSNYLCCLQDPSACLFLFGWVSPFACYHVLF